MTTKTAIPNLLRKREGHCGEERLWSRGQEDHRRCGRQPEQRQGRDTHGRKEEKVVRPKSAPDEVEVLQRGDSELLQASGILQEPVQRFASVVFASTGSDTQVLKK